MVWLGGTALTFAALETRAVRGRKHPTLTATLRRWVKLHPAGRLVFGVLITWFGGHILFEWRP